MLLAAAFAIDAQPSKNLFVPVHTVGRLVHPVPFVRKVHKATWHTLTLQALKQLMPLADWTSKVQIVVNDEHRCFVFTKIARQCVRTELSILARDLPWQSTVLILIEPKLVGRSPHAFKVVHAAMADQAFEFFGDFIHCKPILHVPAEASASGGDSLGVHVFKCLDGFEPSHKIAIALSAPVSADLIAELLAEAGGTTRVWHRNDIPLGCP